MCYDIYCKNNSGEHMKKITVTIQNNTILFKYRTNKPVEENLMNTNVFNNNELVFSDQYLQENSRIVSLFFNDIFIFNHIIISRIFFYMILFFTPNFEIASFPILIISSIGLILELGCCYFVINRNVSLIHEALNLIINTLSLIVKFVTKPQIQVDHI